MKKVNMLKIAKMISNHIEIIGLRPGEIESEDLISEEEVPFTEEIEEDSTIDYKSITTTKFPLGPNNFSFSAF